MPVITEIAEARRARQPMRTITAKTETVEIRVTAKADNRTLWTAMMQALKAMGQDDPRIAVTIKTQTE